MMKPQQLLRLGVPDGTPLRLAQQFIRDFMAAGNPSSCLATEIFQIVADPAAFFSDDLRAPLARAIYRPAFTPRAGLAPWRQWGVDLEPDKHLISAGLDEVPGVYKDIHTVMAAQSDLVEILGRFDPKLVKMCPAGQKAED